MANRETQVPVTAMIVGNPNARATAVPTIVMQGGNPNGKMSQIYVYALVPNIVDATAPGGTLENVLEFALP